MRQHADLIGAADGGATDAALVVDGEDVDGGGADAAPDANVPTCSSDVVLIGRGTLAKDYDAVPTQSVDAYGYATAAGTAKAVAGCAKLYVGNRESLEDGAVVLGVYTDGGVKPGARIAVATFADVKLGWNAAVLDPPVRIAPTQTLWLAVTPTKGSFSVRADQVCGLNQNARMTRNGLDPGDLPDPFNHNNSGQQCGASIFLAP